MKTCKSITQAMLNDFIECVCDDIFKRMEEDFPDVKEEDYDDHLGDVAHEEVDHAINCLYNGEVEELVCEFGMNSAITLYIQNFGTVEERNVPNYDRSFLYLIVMEKINYSYSAYQEWKNQGM